MWPALPVTYPRKRGFMGTFILRRLAIMPLVLLGLSVMVFLMLQMLSPVERAALYVTDIPKNAAALNAIISKYGLDKPIYVQYWNWLRDLLQGNLGWSKTAQMPVLDAIRTFFPATLELALWAFIPIIFIGIWLGIQAALHHNTIIDHAARVFSIIGYSFPSFVFGLLLLMLLYAQLQWLQPGRISQWAVPIVYSASFRHFTGMMTLDGLLNGRFDIFLDALKHLIMPAITLAYIDWALILRVMRSSMLEVLSADYITTAKAKGMAWRNVVRLHARPNAMIPVVTIGGLLLVGLLNGVVITETVFDYQGMGNFVAKAALNFDAISVLGITLFYGALLVIANLVVDVMYAYLDPRIRVS
jgi:peptide/nickel transport system permease protein